MFITRNPAVSRLTRAFLFFILVYPALVHAGITINTSSGAHWHEGGNFDTSTSLTSLFPSETATSVLNSFSSSSAGGTPTVVTTDANYVNLMLNCRTFASPAACAGKIAFGRVMRAGVPESLAAMNRMVVLNGSGMKRYVDISIKNGSVSFNSSEIHDVEIAFLDIAYFRGEAGSPFHRCDSETIICGSKVSGCPAAPTNSACYSLVGTPVVSSPTNCAMNLAIDTIAQPTTATATDGKIAISASGAVGPVNYTITPLANQNGGTFDQLAPNTYTIGATDTTNPDPCTRTLAVKLEVGTAGNGVTQPPSTPGNCSCYANLRIPGTGMAARSPPNQGIQTGSQCYTHGYEYILLGGVCNYVHWKRPGGPNNGDGDWYNEPYVANIGAPNCFTYDLVYGTPPKPACP